MIVTCPSCSVRYLVDARALGRHGRMVRCARCAHTWREVAPEDQALEFDTPDPPPVSTSPSVAASEPSPTLSPERARASAEAKASATASASAAALTAGGRIQLPALTKRKPHWGLVLARVVSALAIVVGLAYAAVAERNRVVALVPGVAPLYKLAGFPAGESTGGLEFDNVTTNREMENGLPALVIEGEVKNVSSSTRTVPKLVVILHDKDEHDLQDVTVAAPADRLNPGESAPFHASISQPAEAASGVVVTFAGADRS